MMIILKNKQSKIKNILITLKFGISQILILPKQKMKF